MVEPRSERFNLRLRGDGPVSDAPCRVCGGAFSRVLRTLRPPECTVCWRAVGIHQELQAIDAGHFPAYGGHGPAFGITMTSLTLLALRPGTHAEEVDPADEAEIAAWREDYMTALAVVAAARWRVRDSWERLTLRSLASEQNTGIDIVKVELLRSGVVLALGALDTPHRYRIARQWTEGLPKKDLFMRAVRFIFYRTIWEARQELAQVAEPNVNQGLQSAPEFVPLLDPSTTTPNPLVRLEVDQLLDKLRARLPSGPVRRLLDQLAADPWLDDEREELARRLGVSRPHLRQLLHRLHRTAHQIAV